MERDLQEQACWLLLAFESGISTRITNSILVYWCKQLKKPLKDFFAASPEEWDTVCHLKPDIIQRLEQSKEKLVGQAFLVEQLAQNNIHLLTVLDTAYPKTLKNALDINKIPPVLFYAGDLEILQRKTVAIIGSRNASETSLLFTRTVAQELVQQGANVISGYARGVDRAAYEGATNTDGYTTVVLPHGIHKLSKVQMRDLQPRIDAGHVLLMSQFHPDAPWLVSRAMERNTIVTGLAQIVIVAESDSKGGTWEGASGALKQKRRLYVRQTETADSLPGNKLLLEKGGIPLIWPTKDITATILPLLKESHQVQEHQQNTPDPPNQLSLLAPLYTQ